MLERLGKECTDVQALRELTVNGLDAIAAVDARTRGRVVWDLDWERFDASAGRVRKLSVIDTGTGCDGVWEALGASVLADHSIGLVVSELAKPRRARSSSKTKVIRWSAHRWDADRWDARPPLCVRSVLLSWLDRGAASPAADRARANSHGQRKSWTGC